MSAFLRIRTLKEALVKATGEGLSRAIDSFWFSLDPIAVSFRSPMTDQPAYADPLQWPFIELRASVRHVGALALHHRDVERVRIDLSAVTRPG